MTIIEFAIWLLRPYIIIIMIVSAFYIVVFGWKSVLNVSRGSIESTIKNIALAVTNGCIMLLFFYSFAEASKAFFASFIPVLPEAFWTGIALPFSLIAYLLATDFANYWSHRILHMRVFWGLHVLHHSDKHMNWSTSFRIHILEYLLMLVCAAFIIGWLQLPSEAAAIAVVIRMWYSKYVHCQLGWSHGRFKKILASPDYHRWHHANTPEAYGKNLCDIFPVWDIMFGTYYYPGPCEAELGVDNVPDNFFLQLVYPFRYWLEGLPVEPKIAAQNTA